MSRRRSTFFAEEEEEQKRQQQSGSSSSSSSSSSSAAAAAASASSAKTVGTFTAQGYKTHAIAHLTADPDSDSDRKMIAQIAAETFCDLRFCNEHGVIGEAVPLLGDPKKAYKQCHICPNTVISGNSVLSLKLRNMSDYRTISDLEVAHKEWVAASEALRNERIVRNAQRMRSSADLASAVDNPAIVLRERESWVVYTLVTFDIVRPHLITRYMRMRKGEVTRADQTSHTNLAAYERFMATYISEFNTRSALLAGGAGGAGDSSAPKMWCFTHQCVGHQFPTGKARGYHPACWICIAADAPRAPKDALADSRGFADMSIFNKMCGQTTTLLNLENKHGGAVSRSDHAAAAASDRMHMD